MEDSGKSFVVEADGALCEMLLPASPGGTECCAVAPADWHERQRCPAERSEEIEYAVSEAITNAVERVYPPEMYSTTIRVTAEVAVARTRRAQRCG